MVYSFALCKNGAQFTLKIFSCSPLYNGAVYRLSWLFMYDQDGVHQEWGEIEHGEIVGEESSTVPFTGSVDALLSYFSDRPTLPTSLGYILRRDGQVESVDIINVAPLQWRQ